MSADLRKDWSCWPVALIPKLIVRPYLFGLKS